MNDIALLLERKFGGVKVVYRNHILSVEVHYSVKDSPTAPCPACKLWKERDVRMIQRADSQGNRWWYCESHYFTGNWDQCGLMFPVGIETDDPGLLAMMMARIKYLNYVTRRDRKDPV